MRVLVSFPGRAGDVIWALPTVRAISEHFKVPVDLIVAGEFSGLVGLLTHQPYLDTVLAHPTWGMDQPEPPDHGPFHYDYDRVYHLAYQGWPDQPLPFYTYARAQALLEASGDGLLPDLSLARPWITVPGVSAVRRSTAIPVGFTEAWFELKLGLLASWAAQDARWDLLLLTVPGSRWTSEGRGTVTVYPCGWEAAARAIAEAEVLLADCSALHVLAVAIGTPVVCYEPMEGRHNPIFYPLGTHDRVRLVRGNDGLPSFDARACEALVAATLKDLGVTHAW